MDNWTIVLSILWYRLCATLPGPSRSRSRRVTLSWGALGSKPHQSVNHTERLLRQLLKWSGFWMNKVLRRCRFLRQYSYSTTFRQESKSPLQQHEKAIGKSNEKVNMHGCPEDPRWEASKFCKPLSQLLRKFDRRSRDHPYPNTKRVSVVDAPPHGVE
jgi:hypothetical protein